MPSSKLWLTHKITLHFSKSVYLSFQKLSEINIESSHFIPDALVFFPTVSQNFNSTVRYLLRHIWSDQSKGVKAWGLGGP
jgi:hypothetical protein